MTKEDVEFVSHQVRCPFCNRINTYQISIQKTLILPYSIFDNCLAAAVSGLISLLLLLGHGFRVLIWIAIAALVITIVDRILVAVLWRLIQKVVWLLTRNPWFSKPHGEILVRPFTVVLTCNNAWCPSGSKKFQIQISLPIERGNYNAYQVEIVS